MKEIPFFSTKPQEIKIYLGKFGASLGVLVWVKLAPLGVLVWVKLALVEMLQFIFNFNLQGPFQTGTKLAQTGVQVCTKLAHIGVQVCIKLSQNLHP